MPTSSEAPEPPANRTQSASFLGLPLATARLYAVLFVVAFVVYWVLWRGAPYLVGDSQDYLDTAIQLRTSGFRELLDRVPGYPLLLIATGSVDGRSSPDGANAARTTAGARSRHQPPTRALFAVSLAVYLASIWLLAAALYSVGVQERWLSALAVVLLLPPYVAPAAQVMSEGLCQAVLVAMAASFILWRVRGRWLWLVAGGLLAGLCALVRPTYQAQGLALAVCFVAMAWALPCVGLRTRDAVRAAAIVVVASLTIVGTYAGMNATRFGYFGLTPLLGFNLSTRTVAMVEQLPESYEPVRSVLIDYRNDSLVKGQSHTAVMYIWPAVPRLMEVTGMSRADLSTYMLRLNLELIARSPLEYVRQVGTAASCYMLPTLATVPGVRGALAQAVWSLVEFALIALFAGQLVAVTGAGLYLSARRRVTSAGLMLADPKLSGQVFAYVIFGLVVVYTMLVSVAVETGNSRYRIPSDSLALGIIVLGGSIWSRLVRHPGGFPGGAPIAKSEA